MKNCLITGGSGFLGGYIVKKMMEEGTNVINIGRSPKDLGCEQVLCDIAVEVPNIPVDQVEIVVHAAGKAHMVPKTLEEKNEFFAVNLNGTKNLLTALEQKHITPRVFVFISTVAVYGTEEGTGINETHPLQAVSPYGISKIRSEEAIAQWCQARGINFYNLRLPLIAGNKPPGNLGKMINAIKKGYYIKLAKNNARKSIVLAQDVADLIPTLGTQQGGAYNLTDGIDPAISEIEQRLEQVLQKKIRLNLGKGIVEGLVKIGNLGKKVGLRNRAEDIYKKLTASLTFSNTKAAQQLNWRPKSTLDQMNYLNL